jgi:hypothetical protein
MKKTVLTIVICLAVFATSALSFAKTLDSKVAQSNDQQQKKETTATKDVKDVYTCPMHPEIKQDKPGKCPKCKMDLEKKAPAKVVYTCPMHPEITKDKPGKCPKCGMDMTEKKPAKSATAPKKQ